jgi:hypothetical protein
MVIRNDIYINIPLNNIENTITGDSVKYYNTDYRKNLIKNVLELFKVFNYD